MKKKLVWIGFAIVAAIVLAACGGEDTEELVISTFGLELDSMQEAVFEPFEEEYGVTIVLDTGTNAERYNRLESNPNLNVDIIELAQSHAAEGLADDLFVDLDPSEAPNMDHLIDSAQVLASEGFGAAYTLNSVGIIYDQEAVGFEITEWEDLWDSSLAGEISIPDISTTFGPAMLYLASDYKGVDITSDDGQVAFEALDELSDNVLRTYSRSSDLANMFQSGEISVAVVGDFAVPMIEGVSDSIEYVVPQSGTYANFNTININKNSDNIELAYKYVDWRLSQQIQEATAVAINEAPSNENVVLDEETARNKTYGEVAERTRSIDSIFVNENLSTWIDQWNRILNQ